MPRRNRFNRTERDFMLESKLLSCPFCSCEKIEVVKEWVDDFHSLTHLHCTNCGVKSKRVFSTDSGREELLNTWNTRANSVTYPYWRRIKSLVICPLISFGKFCDRLADYLINFVRR